MHTRPWDFPGCRSTPRSTQSSPPEAIAVTLRKLTRLTRSLTTVARTAAPVKDLGLS